MLTFRQAACGTGGGYCLIVNFTMTCRRNGFLRRNGLGANGAVGTVCQAFCGAGRCGAGLYCYGMVTLGQGAYLGLTAVEAGEEGFAFFLAGGRFQHLSVIVDMGIIIVLTVNIDDLVIHSGRLTEVGGVVGMDVESIILDLEAVDHMAGLEGRLICNGCGVALGMVFINGGGGREEQTLSVGSQAVKGTCPRAPATGDGVKGSGYAVGPLTQTAGAINIVDLSV